MRRMAPAAWRVVAGLFVVVLISLAAVALGQPVDAWNGPALTVEATQPSGDWVPVTLPDRWSKRWPQHDGTVWYRIRWNAPAAVPTGILIDAYRNAAAVRLNGSAIHGDPHLAEPLSQNQYRAHRWTVDAPLLRAGENTLLVQVVGYGRSWAGLGVVRIGEPAAVAALYEETLRWRYHAQFGYIGVCLACGLICLSFWLFRRHESSYGWTAAAAFAWTGYEWHTVAYETWPFSSTVGLTIFKTTCIVLAVAVSCMALARVAEVRLPRLERAALLAAAGAVAFLVLAPADLALAVRIGMQTVAGAVCAIVQVAFVVYALYAGRLRGASGVIVGLTVFVLPFLVQDTLATAGSVQQRWFVLPAIVPMFLVAMSVTLAARLASSLRVAERFNEELSERVSQARDQLNKALELQRERDVAEARESERRRLLHDLHDGLGGTLVGNITALEAGGPVPSAEQILAVLRDARDDLRLVIDTNFNAAPERSLAEVMSTMRHRLSARLERQGVRVSWDLSALRLFDVSPAQTLDLMRILQELVTNATRHGQASEVRIAVGEQGGTLRLEVSDDGRGFDPRGDHEGIGLKGLRLRAQRLGGGVEFQSGEGGTTVRVTTAIRRPGASPSA